MQLHKPLLFFLYLAVATLAALIPEEGVPTDEGLLKSMYLKESIQRAIEVLPKGLMHGKEKWNKIYPHSFDNLANPPKDNTPLLSGFKADKKPLVFPVIPKNGKNELFQDMGDPGRFRVVWQTGADGKPDYLGVIAHPKESKTSNNAYIVVHDGGRAEAERLKKLEESKIKKPAPPAPANAWEKKDKRDGTSYALNPSKKAGKNKKRPVARSGAPARRVGQKKHFSSNSRSPTKSNSRKKATGNRKTIVGVKVKRTSKPLYKASGNKNTLARGRVKNAYKGLKKARSNKKASTKVGAGKATIGRKNTFNGFN